MTNPHDLLILDLLLRTSPASPETISEFREWKREWIELAPGWENSIDRAVAGGLAADRPAWAFSAGYQAAIQSLTSSFGMDDTDRISAVCITEKDGAHPARIKSCLTPLPEKPGYWQLDGAKTFISGAEEADILWVAASIGKSAEGRNQLRMARVPIHSRGITLTPMPPLGLVPEMPHAEVRFESVILPDAALLPGDGYLKAAKPFRTLEDLHVTSAILAWIFGIGRRAGWPNDVLESILALIVSARGLASASPLAAHVHIALGGVLGQVKHLLRSIEVLWNEVNSDIQKQWRRDRKILEVAETARRMRLGTAWQCYGNHFLRRNA